MLAVPALGAFAVYLPAVSGGFLSDDYSQLQMFYRIDAHEVAARVWKTFIAGVGPASNQYRPLVSLAGTVLAFMSKESAAIGPALIVALAWARRTPHASLVRGIARALARTLPWLAIGVAYFAYRTWIFGDPFRFYPGTSPGSALLAGKWLAALPASADWWPRVMPEATLLRIYAFAGLFIGIAAVSAGLHD